MRDFDWFDDLWCVVKDDGKFAGSPCITWHEARDLQAQHEGSQIFYMKVVGWVTKKKESTMWEINARLVEDVYGGFVNWHERFYNCPECGEPIYECDWEEGDFDAWVCPVCEFNGKDEEE